MSSYGTLELTARVLMDLPLAGVREAFGPWSRGAESAGETRTSWPVGGASVQDLLYAISWVPQGATYTIDADDDVRAQLHEIATRLLAATAPD